MAVDITISRRHLFPLLYRQIYNLRIRECQIYDLWAHMKAERFVGHDPIAKATLRKQASEFFFR